MATTNQFNRQEAKYIWADLSIANIGTGNGVTAKLPHGALVLSADLITVTAFDSATTTTGTIADGTTTFVNAVDVQSTGLETAANSPKYYATGGTITFSLAETGATATVGKAIGVVKYLEAGSCDSIHG